MQLTVTTFLSVDLRASQEGTQNVTNERDDIYQQSNTQLALDVSSDEDGYAATFPIGVQAA